MLECVMRTTLTLDPDVVALLRKRVAKGDVSFKQAVNDAMRKGLTADEIAQKPKKRYVVRPRTPGGGFLVDINDNGALQEMLDRQDHPDLYRR